MGIQQQRIIHALERGELLSSAEAMKKYSIARLSARISELRHQGYPIKSYRRETVNQFGEPTHYCEYYLDGEKKGAKSL